MAKEKKEVVKKEEEFDIQKLATKLKKTYGSLKVAADEIETIEFISTGNKSLDLSLGGGINLENCVELSGFSSSGKTTLMQCMLADMQKKYNAVGIWLDRENAYYNDRSEFLGIDNKNVIKFKPADIPTIPDATQALVETLSNIPKETYKFIGIDSMAAFDDTSKYNKADMGKNASHKHRLFRRILPFVDERTLFVFCNQRTYKPGVMFGDPTTTAGGTAGKYFTSYRIQLDEGKEIKDDKLGGESVGNYVKAKIIKTRSGPKMRSVIIQHFFKDGIPYLSGYIRLLVDRNILQPKNKAEFKAFKNEIILYKDKKLKEYDVEQILKDYPELNFDTYPEYNIKEEENTSE